MKLTDLQRHKIDQALSESQSVLSEIKRTPLKGKNLEYMKLLESAVQHLEIFVISTRGSISKRA